MFHDIPKLLTDGMGAERHGRCCAAAPSRPGLEVECLPQASEGGLRVICMHKVQ